MVSDFDNTPSGEFFNDGNIYIYGHFNNDGVVDFYQNTGLTQFTGGSDQNISGAKVSYLYDVYFNNSSNTVPFKVSGSIDISGEADFYNGILDNDNYGGKITFNTDAFHINTSDYSHVDGPVNKFGNTEFTYPIGDGGFYRFAGISAPSNTAAIFEGKFYFENSDVLYPHKFKAGVIQEIDNQEYWTIKKESSTNEEMLITLSWRDVTTPQPMIDAAQRDALTIVRWNPDTNMWVDEGGAINLEAQTITTAVNGYGVFTFGRVKTDLVLSGDIVVYNSVTPNGDGKNDYFFIDTSNSKDIYNLNVQVFNRWGVKVFESDNYGIDGDVFDGFSKGRMTVDKSEQLPTGTYFYILDYQYGNPSENKRHKQAGFLYLSGN
ncbi:gliding motility-associated C-terminal domain-containing protein [Aequorivita todarodis]|uniref:gliding motility-associated C-terminal domain-containing protein n=1 Tax=Aequorivita todarodis TaxID=2036821 RepID=UPI002350FEE5|nr:gliding motility-associated C-terminal domain-containing protein [Aequorivita todarodis]